MYFITWPYAVIYEVMELDIHCCVYLENNKSYKGTELNLFDIKIKKAENGWRAIEGWSLIADVRQVCVWSEVCMSAWSACQLYSRVALSECRSAFWESESADKTPFNFNFIPGAYLKQPKLTKVLYSWE